MFGLDFIGDALNDITSFGQAGKAQGYLGNAMAEYQKLNPDVQIVSQGPSAFDSADPKARSAQMDALAQLQQEYQHGGLSAIDRARLGDIQNSTAQNAQAAQAGVQQNYARRGLMNSGNALVSSQVAGQGANMLGAQQARDAASLAQQSRLSEIGAAGGLAGDVRGQDYQKAQAQDSINRFNTANQQGQLQQNYANALGRAGGMAGVAHDQSGDSEKDADRNYDFLKTAGPGAIKGAGSLVGF